MTPLIKQTKTKLKPTEKHTTRNKIQSLIQAIKNLCTHTKHTHTEDKNILTQLTNTHTQTNKQKHTNKQTNTQIYIYIPIYKDKNTQTYTKI